jgi:capsule polysaccharide export protein KpsC/LpsZ
MLSYHLPEGYLLYIKVHPQQYGDYMKPSFLYDLLDIANVRLIDRHMGSRELIEHSIAVATITGTAGWEAVNLGKPFLMFGSFADMYAPGVFLIRDNDDCQNAISTILGGEYEHSDRDIKLFYKALEENAQQTMVFTHDAMDCEWDYDALINNIIKFVDNNMKL